ncbi:hypothetical protein CRG98_006730 [Punica granatum]|uniref:Uncharacterized protein n=1 Tax=Punica granatum TaxID=22663 RepID=A0A2I0KWM0_PUNGR|nr:hypothetical protein CRG98_006730 [Punica granatum]
MPEAGVAVGMKVLRQCLTLGAAVGLICRKPASLLELLPVGLPETDLAARAVVLDLSEAGLVIGAVASWTARNWARRWGGRALPEASLAVGAVSEGLDARLPGLLLGMHGYIETFSMKPQQLYRLFDEPVDLGPFSSGCHRAVAFVTRTGDFCHDPKFRHDFSLYFRQSIIT